MTLLTPELTQAETRALGGKTPWNVEAVRRCDGARFVTTRPYGSKTHGAIVYTDGRVDRLERLPHITAESSDWTLTPYGADIRGTGRFGPKSHL